MGSGNDRTALLQRRARLQSTPEDREPARAPQESCCARGARVPLSVAAPVLQSAVIQRVERRVPKGGAVSSSWKYVRTEGTDDIYDDGVPEDVAWLEDTRKIMEDIDPATFSDPEESETEIDPGAKAKKVYRVNNIRDAMKLKHKVLKPNSKESFGARIGGNTLFRLEGKGTQFYVKPVAEGKFLKKDKSASHGSMPKRQKTDRAPAGKVGTYKHFATELLDYTPEDVGQAIFDKFIAKPSKAYPAKFSARAQSIMDEAFAILSIAEVYRTDYSLPLFVAAVKALQAGKTLEQVLYAGAGQLEALHPGASSYSDSKVSGQLMEQNLGLGTNAPHPTQKSMNISEAHFRKGAKRTRALFEAASTGTTPKAMLQTSMMPHFTSAPISTASAPISTASAPVSGAVDITSIVKSTSVRWGADLVVGLKPGKTLTPGDVVTYKGQNYLVNNQTPSGYYRLFEV